MWDFKEQEWLSLEKKEGLQPFTQMLIVAGETLSRLTADYLVSGLHRVVRVLPTSRVTLSR